MWNPFRYLKSEYYLNKGIKEYENNNKEKAIELLKRSSDINSNNELTFINIGIAEEEKGNINKAIENFEIAKKLSKYNPVPACRIAKILLRKGDIDKALDYLKDSLVSDQTYSEAYYIKGMCYIEKKMYDKAAENFEKIIVDRQNLVWARILVAAELIIKKKEV